MPTISTTNTSGNRADAWLIIGMRGLRSFAYGMLAVVLGVVLSGAGLSPVQIGVMITISLIGDLFGTYVIGIFADSWGRRHTLIVLALLMATTGVIFGLTNNYPLLLIAAFFGTLGTSASETAPFLPIEQVMISQVSTEEQRTSLFARYNLVASFSLALGALAAGLPDSLAHIGLLLPFGNRLLFGVYAALALIVALLALRLSSQVESLQASRQTTPLHLAPCLAARSRARVFFHWFGGKPEENFWQRLVPSLGRSRRAILLLTGLFSVDAFAGGFVVQSLMALFFHLRFGVPLVQLAILFFGANTLSALSFLAAVPLARRFGLLNTMVFTHLPSNVLLILVALMPTFPLAAVLLLARQALSQMDVPTRQAYTMALVAPEERTAAASVTSLARSIGSSTSPVFSGLLLQGPLLVLGLPFVLAGALKAAYDCTLWVIFRRVRLRDESDKT